jgi:acetyltransferase
LFDVAQALSCQPVPKSNRVVVVTNAGGPGILATDALINNGLEMPTLTPSTVKELRTFSSADASYSNPMDMVAGAGGPEFNKTLAVIKKDKRYDTIVPIFVPPVTIDQLDVAQNIQSALADTKKTVLACFMGAGEGSAGINYLKSHDIPVYIFPEAIAKTLATLSSYRKWLNRPRGKFKSFKVDSGRVQQIIYDALNSNRNSILGEEAINVLAAYGIPAATYEYADTPGKALTVARKMGLPVVMKIASPSVLHKTEMGGVMVDLRSDKEIRNAFAELKKRVGTLKKGEKFSVAIQQMVSGSVETVIGMTVDPSFGPLLMFGLGGIYVEVMKDVSFRIAPVSDQGATEMIESLRSYPLLTGFRGSAPVHLPTIKETIMRLSQLVSDFPVFSEIDINPFIVSPDQGKCKAVDARFILNPGTK